MKMRVNLFDYAPRIGSGYRIVDVEVGRKWVHLRYDPHGTGVTRAKIKLSTYEKLPKEQLDA